MPRAPRHRRLLLFLAALTVAAVAWPASAAGSRPLTTALYMLGEESFGSEAPVAFDRARAAGATAVRLPVFWFQVVPHERPAAWDPTNPADPHYDFSRVDRQVRLATARGLQPILTLQSAPVWAQGVNWVDPPNSYRPDPVEYGRFAKAVATRYSGRFQGLPRVRHWQAWNEPNISLYLTPQLIDNRPVSPAWYRDMLNAFSSAVRSVHADNLVIAGGLAPFRDISPAVQAQRRDWGPLGFMRELLCLSPQLRPTCRHPVHFDVWAHHPYTSGGPTRRAVLRDDVSLGDLPDMRRVLQAGIAARNVRSRGATRFWVTEFSWDSSPPDPAAVPASLHARWVAEALYRMWDNRIDLVTWFQLRDEPMWQSFYQSGLYFRGANLSRDRPKPALQAFRFPLVALPEQNRVYVWGRTPGGRQETVVIQRHLAGRWRNVATVRTDRHGIFQRRLAIARQGFVRARVARTGVLARPFGIRPVPDRFFNPFGLPELLER